MESINKFASSSYSLLSTLAGESENLFFSPISIYAALSMTYAGSRGNTAEQMKSALGIEGDPDDSAIHQQISKVFY